MGWDSTWDQVFRDRPWGKYPGEDLIRFIARNFYQEPDRSAVKILEVGCGTGANLWYLAREGFSCFGIDGSQTAIEIAKDRLDTEVAGWPGELRCGDIINLPYEDDQFDAVVDIEALSCNSFDDSKRIYAEMQRVLKPGGKLYSRTFACGTFGEGTGEHVGRNAYKPSQGPLSDIGLVRFTAEDEIAELVEGMKLIDIDLKIPSAKPQAMIKEWMIQAEKPAIS